MYGPTFISPVSGHQRRCGLAGRLLVHAIDLQQVVATEVEWRTPQSSGVTAAERTHLQETLRTALANYAKSEPAVNGGRPVVIRAAITCVELVSPELNAVSTVLLSAPWDRGGGAVEIEVVDAETRHPLAILTRATFTP